MLSSSLLNRSLAQVSPFAFAQEQTARFVHALQPAPHISFDGQGSGGSCKLAHASGVNALTVDRFEGRYLLSGGADATISIWDLEAGEGSAEDESETQNGRNSILPSKVVHTPLETTTKSTTSHNFGITTLQFYPFDSLAFLSTSYDQTLKIWSSERLNAGPSASFTLSSNIYSASISPIASHLLVACGTQHPAVRLVDLRSGAATHSLAGHGGGAVLAVAWSPKDENVLVSGATDGTIRFWDIRRSAGCLGTLDLEDSIGVTGYDSLGRGARARERGRAHAGPVNGIVWTEDAKHVVTAGHDEKIRVWETHTGANTLANFGPKIRNRNFSGLVPLVVPRGLLPSRDDILLFPNEKDILMFEMFEGRLLKRMAVSPASSNTPQSSSNSRNTTNRVTALAWRAHTVDMFSAHSDGTVRSWKTRTREDAMAEEEGDTSEYGDDTEADSRKRKRQILEDIEKDVKAQAITFRGDTNPEAP